MLEISKESCTGCGACVQKCPQNCIDWTFDEFGFKYPNIDYEKCVSCNLCEKSCPINSIFEKTDNQTAYAFVNNQKSVLMDSTSGGAFSAIAENVLLNNGVVYGCLMDSSFQVYHVRVNEIDKIKKLRGSKYVQSDTKMTYKMVLDDLINGKYVMYIGTPCQVAGLFGYLGDKPNNLLTVDIICHGVGSQLYFDKFIEYLKDKKPLLKGVKFRNKRFVGWSCGGVLNENGKEKPFYNHEHYYYSYFLSGEIYRKSCYSCRYANISRISDITLGDFWGVESLKLDMNVDKGCSLVIVNSSKGLEIIRNLNADNSIKEIDIDKAIKYNEQLSKPSEYRSDRSKRIKEYNSLSGNEIQKIYVNTHKKRILKGRIKCMIPYRIKSKLRSVL